MYVCVRKLLIIDYTYMHLCVLYRTLWITTNWIGLKFAWRSVDFVFYLFPDLVQENTIPLTSCSAVAIYNNSQWARKKKRKQFVHIFIMYAWWETTCGRSKHKLTQLHASVYLCICIGGIRSSGACLELYAKSSHYHSCVTYTHCWAANIQSTCFTHTQKRAIENYRNVGF